MNPCSSPHDALWFVIIVCGSVNDMVFAFLYLLVRTVHKFWKEIWMSSDVPWIAWMHWWLCWMCPIQSLLRLPRNRNRVRLAEGVNLVLFFFNVLWFLLWSIDHFWWYLKLLQMLKMVLKLYWVSMLIQVAYLQDLFFHLWYKPSSEVKIFWIVFLI